MYCRIMFIFMNLMQGAKEKDYFFLELVESYCFTNEFHGQKIKNTIRRAEKFHLRNYFLHLN